MDAHDAHLRAKTHLAGENRVDGAADGASGGERRGEGALRDGGVAVQLPHGAGPALWQRRRQRLCRAVAQFRLCATEHRLFVCASGPCTGIRLQTSRARGLSGLLIFWRKPQSCTNDTEFNKAQSSATDVAVLCPRRRVSGEIQ